MSLSTIRLFYGVPARRGGRIRYRYGEMPREGRITSSDHSNRLRVAFDGTIRRQILHPTWQVEYLATLDLSTARLPSYWAEDWPRILPCLRRAEMPNDAWQIDWGKIGGFWDQFAESFLLRNPSVRQVRPNAILFYEAAIAARGGSISLNSRSDCRHEGSQ